MKSQFFEKFNHDAEADFYDEDVKNESDPIRAGYPQMLSWIANKSNLSCAKRVLDLGAGTGNLSLLLDGYEELVCVDISAKMLEISENKLSSLEKIKFINEDLLGYFDISGNPFDSIVSSYAIHHLTEAEKLLLFRKLYHSLNPGGIAILGDLMFENQTAAAALLENFLSKGNENLIENIKDEFFWDIEGSVFELEKIGFETEIQRFSELSWAIFLTQK
ncbi:MAG: class I SAM-dependent methyltransferase [SAR324 cluster bacterium]|nr:class I SAM-dependent methyltransferase [SAR324 cluster bacterium]